MIMAIALAKSANGLFEPVWNRQHIRYVQIDVPEKLSIEGRAAFYDATGAYRDMAARGVGAVASSSAASGQPPVVGSPDRAAGAGAWPTHATMRTYAHFP
jgi:glucose-6-phosphate 1-dehydrogenase